MFGDYENFFEWLLDTLAANAAITSAIKVFILIILGLIIIKLFISIIQQIVNLFKK